MNKSSRKKWILAGTSYIGFPLPAILNLSKYSRRRDRGKVSMLFAFIFFSSLSIAQTFKTTQLKCERVKTAYSEKWEMLQTELTKQKINKDHFELFIRVFKNDKIVEVWLKPKAEKEYKLSLLND